MSTPDAYGVEGPAVSTTGWGAVEAPAPVEADVRAEISLLCAADTFPTLAPAQLDWLVARCKRADAANRSIYDADWTPTYDVNWACWKGWELKAANATGQVDFTADGQQVSLSQVVAQCREQARTFRARVATSMHISAPIRTPDVTPLRSTTTGWGVPL